MELRNFNEPSDSRERDPLRKTGFSTHASGMRRRNSLLVSIRNEQVATIAGEGRHVVAPGFYLPILSAQVEEQRLGDSEREWIELTVPLTKAVWSPVPGQSSHASFLQIPTRMGQALELAIEQVRSLDRKLPGKISPEVFDHAATQVVSAVRRNQLAHWNIIRQLPYRGLTRKLDTYRRLYQVRSFIDLNYAEDPSVDDLQAMCLISRSYFFRVFQLAFGVTPNQMLMERRFSQARKFLEQGIFQVSEVCDLCGFKNRSAFSRAYKQRFGISPIASAKAGNGSELY